MNNEEEFIYQLNLHGIKLNYKGKKIGYWENYNFKTHKRKLVIKNKEYFPALGPNCRQESKMYNAKGKVLGEFDAGRFKELSLNHSLTIGNKKFAVHMNLFGKVKVSSENSYEPCLSFWRLPPFSRKVKFDSRKLSLEEAILMKVLIETYFVANNPPVSG